MLMCMPERRAASRRQPQKCPPHVRRLAQEYWLAREAYEADLECTCRGHLGGAEEEEYRHAHDGPTFKALLTDYYAAWRHAHDLSHAA